LVAGEYVLLRDSGCTVISRRRLLTGFVLAWAPLGAAAAQEYKAGKVYRIGYLSVSQVEFDRSWVGAFRDGLRKLGYVEGQNLAIEQRHAAGHSERLPELAAELLRLKIDILVVYGAWLQPKKLPSVIPIVFTVAPDPVREGLVASLARPGGNITGLSDVHADLVPKRLELLKEVVPSASLVAVFFDPGSSEALLQLAAVQATARSLGLTVLPVEVKGPEPSDIERAFATIVKERRTGALLVIAEPAIASHRKRIAEFAMKNRLPVIGTVRRWAEDGFLMSYGTDFHDLWRRAATYVDKILKGAKPADLPVEQPTKFEFVINLKTAKTLGLTIPPSVLLQADQVIE
ncbi:MAG TPA: ABC transporter substrate-binding protein, partial [Methylomirabilota bacterium]|nr:ABC transporter substrate-binding protein [Methylomirabilota bacterium]